MKQRTQIILLGALLVGAAAISSIKRAVRPDAGSRGGGSCCALMSGLESCPTNPGTEVGGTNKTSALTGGDSVTNRLR